MGSIRKILCPVDFSPASEQALRETVALAQVLGAEVHLLHVYEMPLYLAPPGISQPASLPGGATDVVAQLQEQLRQRLEAMKAQLASSEVTVHARIAEGRAAQVCVEMAAAEGFDLIALGTRGSTGLRHMLLGSVAERIVRTSSCPVLTFPPATRD